MKFEVTEYYIPFTAAMAICRASRGSDAGIPCWRISLSASSLAFGETARIGIPAIKESRSNAAELSPAEHSSTTICDTTNVSRPMYIDDGQSTIAVK